MGGPFMDPKEAQASSPKAGGLGATKATYMGPIEAHAATLGGLGIAPPYWASGTSYEGL
jgi:hypothetical protein